MRAHHLFEYDQTRTLTSFEPALANRVRESHLDIEALLRANNPPDGPLDDIKPLFGKWALAFIETADPTRNNAFVVTLCRWYIGREIRYLEDMGRAKIAIQTFVKFKNRIKGVNIRTISFTEFEEKMDAMNETLSRSEMWKEKEKSFYDTGQAELIRNSDEVKIVVPKTEEASCFFGRNTKWCTAATGGWNAFDEYNRGGPLYIVLFKKQNVRWQFHFETGQFMNEKDEELDLDAIHSSPVKNWFEEEVRKSLARRPANLRFMQEPTDEDMLTAMKADAGIFYYIAGKGKTKVPLSTIAARADDEFFRKILKQAREDREGSTAEHAFGEIEHKTIEDCYDLLELAGNYCLLCLKLFPGASKSVKEKMIAIAAKSYGEALQYWKWGPMPDALIIRAIWSDPTAYRFLIDNYDEDPDGVPEALQIKAVTDNPSAIQHIDNPSMPVIEIALKKRPFEIRWIKNQTVKIAQLAIDGILAHSYLMSEFSVVYSSIALNVRHDPGFVEWLKKRLQRYLDDNPEIRIVVAQSFYDYIESGDDQGLRLKR
jgi:hypothetical protein